MRRRIHLQGTHLVARVDATTKEYKRFAAIQIGRSHEVFRRTMPIVVTPSTSTFACERISNHLIWFSCLPIHINQVFVARVSVCCVGGVGYGITRVDISITYGLRLPHAIFLIMNNHAIGTTQQHLSFSIHIPVVGY